MISIPLDIYLDVGLLDHIVILFGDCNKVIWICTAKETINKMKRPPMKWQEVYANCISAEQYSKYIGNSYNSIANKQTNKKPHKNKNCTNKQI